MAYDAAKQHRALATELRAARQVVEVVPGLLDEITGDWAEVAAVRRAMAAYDATPKAVLDHQPEPSKETT